MTESIHAYAGHTQAATYLQPAVALLVVVDWVLSALEGILTPIDAVCGPVHNAEPTTTQLLHLLEFRTAGHTSTAAHMILPVNT
jgi:hypothetical protein